jgi:uncharacterized delta-60 repeat protein
MAEDLEGRTLLSVGLDQNFGFGGIALVSQPPNTATTVYRQNLTSVALQNGQVVAAGFLQTTTATTNTYALSVWRLTTSGALDTSFGTSGSQTVPTTIGGNTYSLDISFNPQIAVQSNGAIDVVAVANSLPAVPDQLMVARFTANGSPDQSFGTSGVELFSSFGANYSLNADFHNLALALGPDGKIVVAASLFSSSLTADVFGIVRFTTNGTPDTTFNTTGVATVAFPNGTATATDDDPTGVVVQPNSSVVVVGTARLPMVVGNTPSDIAVARLNPNGSPDTSFGTAGQVLINYSLGGSTSADAGNGVALDGAQIAIAGTSIQLYATPPPGNPNQAATVTMLSSNGALDTAFAGTGKFALQFTQGGIPFNSTAVAITTLADGSVMIAGNAFEQNTTGANLAGMLANVTAAGALNPTYGTGGVALLAQTPGKQLLVQADGKDVFLSGVRVVRTTAPVPTVVSSAIVITGTGKKASATAVTIGFNTAINPTLASNLKVYLLRATKGRKNIKIKRVSLDATGRMLTISFTKTTVGKGFQVVITPGAIVAADGEVLNGGAPIAITISPAATAATSRRAS